MVTPTLESKYSGEVDNMLVNGAYGGSCEPLASTLEPPTVRIALTQPCTIRFAVFLQSPKAPPIIHSNSNNNGMGPANHILQGANACHSSQ